MAADLYQSIGVDSHIITLSLLAAQEFLETEGNGCFKTHVLACDGMGKTKHVCVQSKTMHGILVAAILTVADNRMAKLSHMDTNLVLTTCFEFALNKRIAI